MFTFPRMISIPAPRPLRCPWLKQGAFQKVAKAALLFCPPILMMSTRVCVCSLYITSSFSFSRQNVFQDHIRGRTPSLFHCRALAFCRAKGAQQPDDGRNMGSCDWASSEPPGRASARLLAARPAGISVCEANAMGRVVSRVRVCWLVSAKHHLQPVVRSKACTSVHSVYKRKRKT
jgi:hypothetical protein